MDVDVHGPGIDARGATFAGISLYVLLGHGRDYAWSATSAGQDIIDTFAVPLCEPDGSKPTTSSTHYRFRGQCLPIDVLEKTNSWTPSPADAHAARLRDAPRRAHQPRARDRARHGARQAGGVHQAALDLLPRGRLGARVRRAERPDDDPRAAPTSSAPPRRSASRSTGSTSTTTHIAYFNSGNNPVRRARGPSTNFPVSSRFEWRNWDPDLCDGALLRRRARTRRRSTSAYLANWNNKQARGTRPADDNFGYGSIYRSQSLSDRIRSGIRGASEDVDHRS